MSNRFSNLFPAWDLFEQLQKEVGQIERTAGLRNSNAVRLWSDAEHAYVEVAMPGVAADDIDVSVEGDRLTLHAGRDGGAMSEAKWLRRERNLGTDEMTIVLPFEAEASQVEAELMHGMLWIRIPRAEATRPTRIPVVAATSA